MSDISRIFNALLDYPISEADKRTLEAHSEHLLSKGWKIHEIILLLLNMEEVDPDIDEDRALARMAKIRAAVTQRLAPVTA